MHARKSYGEHGLKLPRILNVGLTLRYRNINIRRRFIRTCTDVFKAVGLKTPFS